MYTPTNAQRFALHSLLLRAWQKWIIHKPACQVSAVRRGVQCPLLLTQMPRNTQVTAAQAL